MARGKVPIMCTRCGHAESIHIYLGWGVPMPCNATRFRFYHSEPEPCGCPDFTESEGPDHALDRP